MNSLNRTTGLGAYNQWVCPFIYTLPHKAQFFVCLFVFYYIEFNSGWGAASSSRGGLQFKMLKMGYIFNILGTHGRKGITVNTDTDLQVTTDETNTTACQCGQLLIQVSCLWMCQYTWSNNWPCTNASSTSQETDTKTTICHWSRGYDFALSNFLRLQTGLVTASVGLDPLCWMALVLYMRSERAEGMLACIDAGQWTYCFNLLKDLYEASSYCWSHLSGHLQSTTTLPREK